MYLATMEVRKYKHINFSAIHGLGTVIPPPTRYPTPYGGRLEWTCPGGNKIIAHLKDKVKIRHKKRWSQVKDDNSALF